MEAGWTPGKVVLFKFFPSSAFGEGARLEITHEQLCFIVTV